MDIRTLQYFLAVAREESISGAAEFLHMTQPPLSRQLKELEAELITLLGGRAAEELKFDSVTTGASNDIEKATKTARAMITMYGMSDKFGMVQLESIEGQYLDRNLALQCSDETATKIDKEIRDMLRDSYNKAKKLLSAHMAALDSIASFLIEHETITGKEFMSILAQVEPQR